MEKFILAKINTIIQNIGSGKVLKQAIQKYGIENFKKEILEYCNSEEDLNDCEIFWINKLKSTDRTIGYNIAAGGTGGDVFSFKTEEEKSITRKRISDASKKMWKDEDYRQGHIEMSKKQSDPAARKKMSKSIKRAYDENPEFRKKVSEAAKKTKHTTEWNKKVGNNNVIRYHGKKIEFFLNRGIDITILSNFFNVPVEKIKAYKKFSKEPNIEILIESYRLHIKGHSYNYIIRNLKDAPNINQFDIFKRLCIVCELNTL